jgi:hypothetical protein
VDKTGANTCLLASEFVGEVGLPLDGVLAQHEGVDLELTEKLRLSSEEGSDLDFVLGGDVYGSADRQSTLAPEGGK